MDCIKCNGTGLTVDLSKVCLFCSGNGKVIVAEVPTEPQFETPPPPIADIPPTETPTVELKTDDFDTN